MMMNMMRGMIMAGVDMLYDDEREDLDYTVCSLECGYCGHYDY